MTVLPFRSAGDVDAAIPEVAGHLRRGGLIAYPTETVYGLGSRVDSNDLAHLAEFIRRPSGKPFLMLIAAKRMLSERGLSLSDPASRLAGRFWPGPLTMVLPATDEAIPGLLRGPGNGVAVRWTSHPETGRLIERMGMPLSSTSANMSGEEPLAGTAEIVAGFADQVSSGELLVLDGGTSSANVPSTLVDCTSSYPSVLREGAISGTLVRACLEEGYG